LLFSGLSKFISATTCSGQARALTDVARRGPSYKIKSSEPAISDSALPSGWYFAKDRVRYYTLVNGTAPKYVHCGTYNPIYIEGIALFLLEMYGIYYSLAEKGQYFIFQQL
jgi:hypothetical protein